MCGQDGMPHPGCSGEYGRGILREGLYGSARPHRKDAAGQRPFHRRGMRGHLWQHGLSRYAQDAISEQEPDVCPAPVCVQIDADDTPGMDYPQIRPM